MVRPRVLAAVRREIPMSEIGATWGEASGKVWDFIHAHPDVRTDGHNIFVYRQTSRPDLLVCDFGVEVARSFEPVGEVFMTETPGGEAAIAVHRGPYSRLGDAYDAIARWMAANQRESAGVAWEIYGDPTPDPADTETTVVQLLV